MSQTRVLVLLAGAALSIGAPALAQNANLDKDRAYAAELVNDAGSRASLLQGGGGGAGHDANGFYITDGTGNNMLYIGGAAQFRYQHNFRDEDAVGENEDFTHGFSNNNVRLWTWGHVWSKDLTYKIQFQGSDTGDGVVAVEDVWGNYAWDNGVSVKWGQFKLPIFTEENIDSEKQLGIDRSNANDIFSQGYSQGLMLTYASDSFRVSGAFSDGVNTGSSSFDSSAESDYALTLRGDLKFAGNDWARFDDFTSFKNQDTAGKFGVALHWQDGGETGGTVNGAGESSQNFWWTADVQFEGAGWNVFGAFLAQNDKTESAGGDTEENTYGAVLQGGLFLADQLEAFARWDGIFWDDDVVAVDNNHFISAGVNYYISPESHAVKFTGQLTWALNETDVAAFDNNSILGQAEDGEVSLGFQMQVMF